MDDPYGLLPANFDIAKAMKELEDYMNPPLQLKMKPPKEKPLPKVSSYDYRAHLEAHLLRGMKQGHLDMETNMTIRYCFADIYRLFSELCPDRKNFLSYGFFINRILELHGKPAFAKEPVSKAAVKQNWALWEAYEQWLAEILG